MSLKEDALQANEQISALIQSRQFEAVHSECARILGNPSTSETQRKQTLHQLATACYMQGNLSKSISLLKDLLERDPKYTDAAISLSIIYNDIGKYDEAKRIYQIANQSLQQKRMGSDGDIDKRFSLKHLELGDLYFKFKRYDESLEEYSKAGTLDPSALQTRIKIAKCYAKKGFTTRALQELQQLAAQNPAFLEARIQLGLMYFSVGKVLDAQLEWEKIKAERPENREIDTYLTMARQATETNV